MLQAAYRRRMIRDEYGYPLDEVLTDRFHEPVPMAASAEPAERHAHQVAYNAYQERFRVAFMEKVLGDRPDRSD